MRKSVASALLVLALACGREQRPDESARTMTLPQNPRVPKTATSAAPAATPAPAPRGMMRSTPQHCAGDGSYEQAIDCFHISSGFRFRLTAANGVRVEGELKRPSPGLERIEMRTSDGAVWTGEAKKQGVVWSRGGTRETAPPEITSAVWLRTTTVLDPQKKEGKPQLAGVETFRGESCNHWRFTNANNGDVNDLWVSTKDGRILRWKAGAVDMEIL